MSGIARFVLYGAGTLIALGGFYDVLVPRLPPNLSALCEGREQSSRLVRELLRALGGCLIAIGAAVVFLVSRIDVHNQVWTLGLVLLLVLPSEGLNAFIMYRVGSPFYVPLTFLALTLVGVLLA